MEPLDPGKNAEGSGYSKRRISSILKAPRKSSVLRDSEQQENEVETAKPVEKRNSRRVSFAPANDVLLFAKDVKNASPARSPLQELMGAATATTQNRVQLVTTEDTSLQIVGIETLLNAPLHASQQRIMVHLDSDNDIGEKTVMFSTEDAVMDMTHSHTIHIINDAELLGDLSHQNYDLLLSGERNEIDAFTEVPPSDFVQARNQSSASLIDKKADSSVEKRTLSTTVPLLDPSFKDFLSSLSKPSLSSTSAVLTRMTPSTGPSFDERKSSLVQSETQSSDVDKENQVPKSLSSSRNIGETFHGSVFHPEDDVSMDMTEAQTGCILGANDDDDPFQCLLPTQEMYEKSERRAPAREMKKQQSCESLESNDSKAKKSLVNPSVHTPHESVRKVCSVLKNDCREKTVVFTADEFMDITQSHTVDIIRSSLTPALMSANSFDPRFTEFPVSLSITSNSSGNPENPRVQPITAPSSKQTVSTEASLLQHEIPRNYIENENYPLSTNRSCSETLPFISPEGDISMDMTEVQTSRIMGGDMSMDVAEVQTGCIMAEDISMDMTEVHTGHITGALGLDDPFQFLIPLQEIQPLCKSQKKEVFTLGQQNIEGPQPSNQKGMETSSNLSLNMEPQRHQDKVVPLDDYREKTLRFSADVACLDVTQSHTVNISTNIKLDSHQNVNVAPTCEEKTVRFSVDDAPMDMTQCLTINIATNLASDLSTSVGKQEDPPGNRFSSLHSLSAPNNCDADSRMVAATAESSNGFTVYQEDDMDMTEAQTGRILGAEVSVNVTGEMPRKREPLQAVLAAEGMHRESVHGRTKGNTHQHCNEAFGTSNYAETSMKTSLKEITQRNQVEFDSKDDYREKTVRFAAADGCKDVTRCSTLDISSDIPLPNMVLAANGEKTIRFNANDAEMDVTKSHTVNIMRDLPLWPFPNVVLPANGEKTVMFNANDAAMDVTRSHTVDIAHDLNVLVHKKGDFLPADGERTRRFGANDAEMDVTKSHTVNIMRDLPLQSFPNVTMPSDGEKTVRFSANDAAMDVTRSHTVKICTDFKMLSNQNGNSLPAGGEKTVRFTTNDATMDMTRSHTVNIAHDLNLLAHQKLGALPADGEKTVRFGVNDAEMEVTKSLTVKILANSEVASDQIINPPPAKEANLTWLATNDVTMDVTRSHTVSIVTDFDQNPSHIMDSSPTITERINNTLEDETGSDTKSISKNYKLVPHRNVKLLPKSGVKAAKFTTSDATMDMTHCPSVNIVSNHLLDPVISDQNATSIHENMNDTLDKKETDSGNCGMDSNPSSSAQSEHAALNNSLFQTSCAQSTAEGDAPLCLNSSYSCLKIKEPDTDAVSESPSLVSDVVGKPTNETKTDTEDTYARMDMSEDQAERLVSSTDNPPQGISSKQDPQSKRFKESDLTFQSDGALGSSVSDEHQPEAETQAALQKMESSPSNADQNADFLPSRISRRKSLADLQSKVRRLSQLINAAPDATAMESCTAPLSHLDPDLDKNPNGKSSFPCIVEPVLEVDSGKNTNVTEAEHLPVATSTTPFSLKTKQLMSRLSVGGFKPKLPRRKTANELKKSAFKGEPTKTFTIGVPNQLCRFDKITDIYDEELVDYEDFSETIDTTTPEKTSKNETTSDQFSTFQPLNDDAFMDDFMSSSQRQKRSLLENKDEKEDEKRQKMCTELTETASQPDVDGDSNVATARSQTIDSSSSSHTISRCEIASESYFKYSLFDSQLEDYSSEGQKKLEDGTITVLEFFNLFSIDFVIHNPRQSVLPGRLQDNSDVTPLDLLKDKYINRPKQTVYETDVQTLTEKVEELKYRMQDLGKPLKTVNRSLWEEVKHFTEKELKSFGAKLKERNNFFRKNSKVQSHEMKEVLYTNLVQANLEEQQKLRRTINQADEMIQSLDSCIGELEAELSAVEEKGSEDKPSLKSLQEEMSKVTETLADSERQISELDLGKTKNSSDLKRLKAEERNLQSHIDTLNMLNEWRLEEKDDNKDNCSVYTFLHRTLFLCLVYEKTNGNDADSRSERKITNISFNFNLSDKKSQSHAHLVHKLVSQYIEGESSWVEKYPTSRHVPKLLHDVSLVVSRCRLVGEELRLLKMWGSLRFDILNISCSETQVHVVFSSLKKRSKFEVVFAARLTDQLCVFHAQSVKNLIGNTTIQQIEEVVASLSPGKNLFTRIVRKLHETLLS